jgi:hypothetical protein
MKTLLSILATFVFALIQLNGFSQETCKVLKPEISEKYVGNCKKGLADGKGFAEGKDKYEGKFKKGLPNGKGKYTWSTGEVYDGNWKDGKRNGEGKYTFKSNGYDSTQVGIWKDDSFFKKIVPSPYTVYRSNGIKRYTVRRIGDGNRMTLSLMQDGSNNSSISGFSYYSTSGTTFSVGPKPGYENITFPCTFKVYYRTQNSLKGGIISVEFEIEIKEPGNWDITINN